MGIVNYVTIRRARHVYRRDRCNETLCVLQEKSTQYKKEVNAHIRKQQREFIREVKRL